MVKFWPMCLDEIIIATKNRGKALEICSILKDSQIKLLTLNDYPNCPDVIEDGDTFEANAIKKALSVAKYTGKTSLADDSGLEVYALGNRPGVYSARFAGEKATDDENNNKLLREMKGLKGDQRKGRFVCVIAVAMGEKIIKLLYGSVQGIITESPRGDGGFGYDPIFIPDGFDKTFGELEPSIKNSISHRGLALNELKKYIGNCRIDKYY